VCAVRFAKTAVKYERMTYRYRDPALDVQRAASQTLVELILYSSANMRLLAGAPAAPRLFGAALAACGDFATQLDLMEVLYR